MLDTRQLDLFAKPPVEPPVAPAGAHTVLAFPVAKRRRPGARMLSNATGPSTDLAVVAFPQDRRHSKVQDVATKLLSKTTARAVDHYCGQVTEAMLGHLAARGIPAQQHGEQLRRFWVAVDCEVARRLNGRQPTGGAA